MPVAETIQGMNDLQRARRVDHISVSNFSVEQIRSGVTAPETPIVTNQMKYNPFHHQHDRLAYWVGHDVVLTAYSPLAGGRVADDRTLRAIGRPYGETAVQVALRWSIQQPNVIAIPKAADAEHARETSASSISPSRTTRSIESSTSRAGWTGGSGSSRDE